MRLKLNYDEVSQCADDVVRVRKRWNAMLQHVDRNRTRFDRAEIEDAVRMGMTRQSYSYNLLIVYRRTERYARRCVAVSHRTTIIQS
jgi:hypothetical protein